MYKKIEAFGSYLLLKKIATGGMSEVFLARPGDFAGNRRLLVIKRILPHIANHPEFAVAFEREIQTINGFNHANIVQLHDFGIADGHPYIAMEYIEEGRSLRDIVTKTKLWDIKIPVPVALSIAAQAAGGLHYAHTFTDTTNGAALNIIHRDISPHNLILSCNGKLKIIDFGIAKAATSIFENTQPDIDKGKAGYLSPEALAGTNIDARSDIFSLGVVAWELLAGERLFAKPRETEADILMKVSQSEKYVSKPSSYNKDVASEIDDVILKALEKDPAMRFHDAEEFQTELRRVSMKYFPTYHYADTGQVVSLLFDEDIRSERFEKEELIESAQSLLFERDQKTIAIPPSRRPTANQRAAWKLTKQVAIVAFRLSKIEIQRKQKATGRHYLMFMLYLVSLFFLKFGDLYNYWTDFSGQKTKASITQITTRQKQ